MNKIVIGVGIIIVIFVAYLILIPYLILEYGKNKIYTEIDKVSEYPVAIVFGAGLKPDGTPNDMLKDRLDTAVELYEEEKIQKFLLSGDNSLEDYNEPQAMYDYLVNEKEIPQDDVVRDFAGLRTYDTCIRAKEIWGLDEAILISQGYHLSRAIYTCNSLGLKSTGYSATKYDYAGERYYKLREVIALHKAVIDLFIFPPEYIGGEMEDDFL